MSDTRGSSESRPSAPRRRTMGLLVAVGVVVMLSAMLFSEWHRSTGKTELSPGGAATLSVSMSGRASGEPTEAAGASARVTATETAATTTAKSSDAEPSIKDRECKRAPIRGCAPSKDPRGCYHCSKCWRPLHYDLQNGATAVSFACPEMPDAPLYVEITGASPPGAVQGWTASVSFDGRRFEQPVTPNLGAVFFSGFRGGNVEVTAALQRCEAPVPCHGDVDVTVNARSEGR